MPQMLVALFSLFTSDGGAAKTVDLQSVIAGLQVTYSGVQDASLHFRAEFTSVDSTKALAYQGKIWAKPASSIRVEYYIKKRRLHASKGVIYDGNNLFLFDHEGKKITQVAVPESDSDATVVNGILFNRGKLPAGYEVEIDRTGAFGGDQDVVILLSRTDHKDLVRRIFYVIDSQYHVVESVVVLTSGTTEHYWFDSEDLKATFDASLLQFDKDSAASKAYKFVSNAK